MKPAKWSRDKPKECGFYWYEDDIGHTSMCYVLIKADGTDGHIEIMGKWKFVSLEDVNFLFYQEKIYPPINPNWNDPTPKQS